MFHFVVGMAQMIQFVDSCIVLMFIFVDGMTQQFQVIGGCIVLKLHLKFPMQVFVTEYNRNVNSGYFAKLLLLFFDRGHFQLNLKCDCWYLLKKYMSIPDWNSLTSVSLR